VGGSFARRNNDTELIVSTSVGNALSEEEKVRGLSTREGWGGYGGEKCNQGKNGEGKSYG